MEEIQFEEKQFLGFNKYSVIRRMTFAIFCFLAYYFSDQGRLSNTVVGQITDIENNGDLFFLMGIMILLWSTFLIFVLHIKTQVYKGYIMIDGLWTSRKVKIDLSGITSAKVIKYSRYFLNRPVYNLHRRGKIRFYTRGNEAVELTDREGLKYIIGSQQSILLRDAISGQLAKAE